MLKFSGLGFTARRSRECAILEEMLQTMRGRDNLSSVFAALRMQKELMKTSFFFPGPLMSWFLVSGRWKISQTHQQRSELRVC